jgi:Protein of unknown function (DUF2490)
MARRCLLLPLLCSSTVLLRAQAGDRPVPRTDSELWVSAAIEAKPFRESDLSFLQGDFFRRLRTSVEIGYRGNENLTSARLFYTILGFRYRVWEHLRIGAEHRYNSRGATDANTQRTDIMLIGDYEVGRFTLDYRVAGQHEYLPVTSIRDIVRNRLEAAYNTRKSPFDPYASAEHFFWLHYTGNRTIGMRYAAGVRWNLDKVNAANVGVRYDREINLADPLYRTIFAFAFEHTIK